MKPHVASFLLLASLAVSSRARADEPFVVLTDDGTIEESSLQTVAHLENIQTKLLDLYAASGEPMPEIMSVWTTFPFAGNNSGTYFDPLYLDVTGIGLEEFFGGDGTYDAGIPTIRSILFHNNVLKVDQAAAQHDAPVEGYGEYLFLLELSHNWGPALRVPEPNPDALIGFPFHWSFFMDAGGSPAGGGKWIDHGDGTFTVDPIAPSELKFSPVDLYIMGLIPPEEVPPFYVIEEVVAPATPTDPLWGGAVAPHTFPWFDAETPLTVSGTRRDLTIDDVIAATGERSPVSGTKTSYTLGIVLLASKDDTAEDIAAAKEALRPIASNLVPTFATATSGKGSLELVTNVPEVPEGTGGGAPEPSTTSSTSGSGAGGADDPAVDDDSESGCSCRSAKTGADGAFALFAIAWAAALSARRRPRSKCRADVLRTPRAFIRAGDPRSTDSVAACCRAPAPSLRRKSHPRSDRPA
jgi:MYXO-CTERM domain-containing protein